MYFLEMYINTHDSSSSMCIAVIDSELICICIEVIIVNVPLIKSNTYKCFLGNDIIIQANSEYKNVLTEMQHLIHNP